MEESLNPVFPGKRLADACSPDPGQESAWVTASQRGDTLAFNRLVLKWERPIYNLTMRLLQDVDEAEEATQEVFCSAFRNIQRFRLEAKFSTWLYRIAVNHCISRLRRRPPHTHLSLDDLDSRAALQKWPPAQESHERDLLEEEKRQHVRIALEKLTVEQRVVVELKFFQDRTFEEIAAIVNVPLSTVKSRLYAGLEYLKLRLGSRSQHA